MNSQGTIVDVNATLGVWPFRTLRNNTADSLVSLMDAKGISEAWVASFECVLNRESKTANIALAESTERHSDRLRPFATVNPNFPGWEADLAFYLDDLGVAGVRTYPNYHGYELDHPGFGELLDAVRQRGAPMEVAVRVADERMHHPLVKVPAVDLTRVPAGWPASADAEIVFVNVRQNEFRAVAGLADGRENVRVEISHAEGIGGVGGLFDLFAETQVLFGTHAPLLYPDSALLKLREADLTEAQLEALCFRNAARVLKRLTPT